MSARRAAPHVLETDDFLTSHAAPAPAGQAAVQDQIPEDRLYTYVIVRGDLEMAPGKTASQAVHAARLSLLRYIKDHPDRADEFISKNSCGSVVVLVAKNLMQLEEAHARAVAEGLPAALFVPSGPTPLSRHRPVEPPMANLSRHLPTYPVRHEGV